MSAITLLLTGVLVGRGWAAEPTPAQPTPAQRPYNPYAKLLEQAGIEPTLPGVTAYLRSLVPTAAERARRNALVEQLIEQLGDASFARREEAMHKLVALPDLPRDKLQSATRSEDPEIRWRCELVLKETSRPDPLPAAVCRTIEIWRIKGAAPILLKVLPELDTARSRRAAEDALAATARPEDALLLREAMDSDDVALQAAAIAAYGAALKDEAKDELQPLLGADDVQIQLAAAAALANLGDRRVLPSLLALMEHEEVQVRARAVEMLRGLTGEQFGYLAYADVEQRAKRLAAWRQWIDEKGSTAELSYPLPTFGRRAEIGHTLILVYQDHKAIELNADGEVIWEKGGLDFPWAVQRLKNGNTLIGSYRGQYVVEFDPQGEQVWRKDGLPGGVFGLERLPNGNTLLGLHKAKKVIEIDQTGDTVWEVTLDGQPMGVQRLPNGNTVVALHSGNKVVEIDPAGEVVWQVTDVKIPRTVQRLPNGNTLVGDSSGRRAVEFDREGNVVWSYRTDGSVYDAQRLPNGNTLVSGSSGVVIVDPEGKVVWEKKIQGAGRALRF